MFRPGVQQWDQFLALYKGEGLCAEEHGHLWLLGAENSCSGRWNVKMLSEDFVSSVLRNGTDIYVGYRTAGVDMLDAGTMTVW